MNEQLQPDLKSRKPSKLKRAIGVGVASTAMVASGVVGYGLHGTESKSAAPTTTTTTTSPKPKKITLPLTPNQKDWSIAYNVVNNIGDTKQSPWTDCNNPYRPVYNYNISFGAMERPLAEIKNSTIKASAERIAQYLVAQQVMWSLDNFEGDGRVQTGPVVVPNSGNPVVVNTVSAGHDRYAMDNIEGAISIPTIKAETVQLVNYLTAEAVVNQDLTTPNNSAVIHAEQAYITDPTLKTLVGQALSDERQIVTTNISNHSYSEVSQAAQHIYS
jgi:hypothetical protein